MASSITRTHLSSSCFMVCSLFPMEFAFREKQPDQVSTVPAPVIQVKGSRRISTEAATVITGTR